MKFAILMLAVLSMAGCGTMKQHGVQSDHWEHYKTANVTFDDTGVATIQADSWDQLITAQGYVTAADRLWHMDLLRKKAAGRLSEWFGSITLEFDKRQKLEDWQGVADAAYAQLPADERNYVDLYAAGVNRFIEDHQYRWGFEYVVLSTEPEPWSGVDTMLVLLQMSQQLSAVANLEAAQSLWRNVLDDDWEQFLFPVNHPWNIPMFGQSGPKLKLPPKDKWLPTAQPSLKPTTQVAANEFAGSNNWAWRGTNAYFVANDPHLPRSVPSLWYAIRLRISASEWVVGVSIPGIPGVILGMNQSLAWAFTNTEEDVDDFLLETLSKDGANYLFGYDANGKEIWRPIEHRHATIKVRNAEDVLVTAMFTHRGPLAKRKYLGDQLYSRQWLGFAPGILRAGIIQWNQARSWEELNQAMDKMQTPAQNVLVMDRVGGLGYRTTGTGVIRQVSGRYPQPAVTGEWLGLEPPIKRRRLWRKTTQPGDFLATANERIWVDKFGHPWGNDERKERITRFLATGDEFTIADMKRLQHDTESRFFQTLLRWTATYATASNAEEKSVIKRWQQWDGQATSDATTFTDAINLTQAFYQIVFKQIKQHLMPTKLHDLPYASRRGSAWVLTILEHEHGLLAFGLDRQAVATKLLANANDTTAKTEVYSDTNRWQVQHPFANQVPFVGKWFRLEDFKQDGYPGLVKTEGKYHGAGIRLLWDVKQPEQSLWSLTVGQSGHIDSRHYRDLHQPWFEGRYVRALDPRYAWK